MTPIISKGPDARRRGLAIEAIGHTPQGGVIEGNPAICGTDDALLVIRGEFLPVVSQALL